MADAEVYGADFELLLQSRGLAPEPVWLLFRDPVDTAVAWTPEQVLPAMAQVEEALADGLMVAGFVTYEAASGFDPALRTHARGTLPLLWFGAFAEVGEYEPRDSWLEWKLVGLKPSETAAAHRRKLGRIKEWIAAGDTYQVNHTFRLRGAPRGHPWQLAWDMWQQMGEGYPAYLRLGRQLGICASPELFFALEGDQLLCRPMKGTRPRGHDAESDERLARELVESPKDRAENLMILDMVRNDLGRIAEPGSIAVHDPFRAERYPTTWQMTSAVTATSQASLTELLTALFPCASVTGAPKVRTMELIAELEDSPRGLYCGTIGYMLPDRSAQFNVAIRTAVVDLAAETVEYGTGGGIVWDSDPAAEYAECLDKAKVLDPPEPAELLETLLWTPERGYVLLDRHLDRLERSGAFLEIPVDRDEVARLLAAAAQEWHEPRRVRLIWAGEWHQLDHDPAPAPPTRLWVVALAKRAVQSSDRLLYHKTTRRRPYEQAAKARPGYDDVLLFNERGEVTESTLGNVVFLRDGRLQTPPVACGLLPGVYRETLLERGWVSEGVLRVEELAGVEALYVVNSVRGIVECRVGDGAGDSR